MFGFGKKKIKVIDLVDEIIVILWKWRAEVLKKAKETGLSDLTHFTGELGAFVYSAADIAIQASNLNSEDQAKIAANLEDKFAKKIKGMAFWRNKTKIAEGLLVRSIEYWGARKAGGVHGWSEEMVCQFFEGLGEDLTKGDHDGVAIALINSLVGIIDDTKAHINYKIGEKYKLV